MDTSTGIKGCIERYNMKSRRRKVGHRIDQGARNFSTTIIRFPQPEALTTAIPAETTLR
jgi:hypothetical protein